MIEDFSTNAIPEAKRLAFWNSLLDDTYNGLVYDPSTLRFSARMSRWQIGDTTMLWPKAPGGTVQRRASNSQSRGADNERVVVHLLHEGKCRFRQRGRTAELTHGDLVAVAASERYDIDIQGDHQFLVVELDKSLVASYFPAIDDFIGRPIKGNRAQTRMLHSFLLSFWREGAAGIAFAAAADYAAAITHFFVMCLKSEGADHDLPALQSRGMVAERMRAVVEARLLEPDLTPQDVADELGVSLRTLQYATARSGTTVANYIVTRRLELAAQQLVTNPHQPITQIAFACGFQSSSYFTRRFTDQYGKPPSALRRKN